jgi:hypothetical protein
MKPAVALTKLPLFFYMSGFISNQVIGWVQRKGVDSRSNDVNSFPADNFHALIK